jgi:hypothetical protein
MVTELEISDYANETVYVVVHGSRPLGGTVAGERALHG